MEGAGAGAGKFRAASLYVGDLAAGVTEHQLFGKFSGAGPVLSVRLCRARGSRRPLGYAYVNFLRRGDAQAALDTMNFDELGGRPMRLMWAQPDARLRRSGEGNVFIKNLDRSVDGKALLRCFSAFGRILSAKVAADRRGPKGFAFVHFQSPGAAARAIAAMDGRVLAGRALSVRPFQPRRARDAELRRRASAFTAVRVRHLPRGVDDARLAQAFRAAVGAPLSARVVTDGAGRSRGCGFVSFASHEQARRAVEAMDGRELDGRRVAVGPALGPPERDAPGGGRPPRPAARPGEERLYVRNLDEQVDEDALCRAFSAFGPVSRATVVREDGRSRGFGLVCFSRPDEAARASAEMNGRLLGSKPLSVALARWP
ncbi:polyadenylate-binding protein 4-like [Perognathus longimembris pacificus]|uniref:polyadenylate-binding protein 4-like n=1 Tax=Perognathus longimembris pacificus TaxID=214514 RepID=UPI002019EBC2|nr:polyadenylate-binding protein 4-like [Perognathus longimembris pacificus]